MNDAQGITPENEVVAPGGAESTQLKEESTVSLKDTPEFKAALDKAVGKGVSSIQSQLSISKAEAIRAKAEAELSKALQEETEKRLTELEERNFADDPEALKGYKLTKTLELREKKAALKEAALALRDAEQEERAFKIARAEIGFELQKEYKVPTKVLMACTSEEQMRSIAEEFPKVEDEPKEEVVVPKFAGAGSGGGSGRVFTQQQIDGMSMKDLMANQVEINKARMEGRIK